MYIIYIIKVVLAFYLLKSGLKKASKIYDFYESVKAYNMQFSNLKHLVVFLIALELLTAVFLVLGIYDITYLVTGLILQIVYLSMQIKNLGLNHQTTCDCFTISLPNIVTINSIIINLSIMFVIITLYGISIRL